MIGYLVKWEFKCMLIILSLSLSPSLPLSLPQYIPPDRVPVVYPDLPMPPTHRQSIVNAFVYVHQTLYQANTSLQKRGGRTMAITPRHYLDFINHYVSLCVDLWSVLWSVPDDLLDTCNDFITCCFSPSLSLSPLG